jgi:hypothetical protein
MAIDPNRGTFVLTEYRWEPAIDDTVLAKQPEARSIKLETNLDLPAAQALADEVLAENKHVAQAFTFSVQGVEVCSEDKFIDSPPTFRCNFSDWPTDLTTVLRPISTTTDYGAFKTTVTVKGPQ